VFAAAAVAGCGTKNKGPADAGCVAPSTLTCTLHSDCANELSCAPGAAVCDLASHACTGLAVSYRNWDSTSPQATDFTCLPTPGTRGTPAQLRVRGCIESFGTSANTSAGALKVAFFRADDLVTPILT